MRIVIPVEVLPYLGYEGYDWVVIREVPSKKTLMRMLDATDKALERISGSPICPIIRSIPVQTFKEELLALLDPS